MKPVVIWAFYDCIIKINDKEIPLSCDCHLTINEYDEIFFKFKNNSEYFKINLKNNEYNYSVIEKEDKYLIFLLKGEKIENSYETEIKYKDLKSQIEVFPSKIVFSCNHKKKTISFFENIDNVKCGNINHINYALFDYDGQKNFIAYNVKTNTLRLFKGKEINIENNSIIVINKHYKNEYFIDEEGLKIKNCTLQEKNSGLVLANFFNAIKNNDNYFAQSLLSNNLKEKVNINSLKEFLGDVKFFYPLSENSCFVYSNGKGKIFEMNIVNNKITDIYD